MRSKIFYLTSCLSLLAALALLLATVPPAHAQTATPTPTLTATPGSSMEEVFELPSGSYLVVQHSISYGEISVGVFLLVLIIIIYRSSRHATRPKGAA